MGDHDATRRSCAAAALNSRPPVWPATVLTIIATMQVVLGLYNTKLSRLDYARKLINDPDASLTFRVKVHSPMMMRRVSSTA